MSDWIGRLEGRLLAVYAHLIERTCRLEVHGWEHVERARASGRPLLFAAWHGGNHLLFPIMKARLDLSRMVLVVAGDERQPVLESFARGLGLTPFAIAMQEDTMSGARSLMRLIRELRRAKLSYINPDGPDGPARVAKRGVAFIATRAEAQILPIAAASPGAYRLKRWDRYSLPFPLARIITVVGEGLPTRPEMDHTRLLADLSERMSAVRDQAEALAR